MRDGIAPTLGLRAGVKVFSRQPAATPQQGKRTMSSTAPWARTSMPKHLKPWVALALVSAVALAVGYALPRPRRGGDLLDAVMGVQRRSPRFLISEPLPPANWAQTGALYLCRSPRSAEDVEALTLRPWRPERWAGVVCFRGTTDPNQHYVPWVTEAGDRCLDYGAFSVFGDPEVLQEVRAILAAEGFQPVRR